MPSKKFIVRAGYVVVLAFINATNGNTSERRFEGGEEVALDEDQAAQHLHKLEFASQRDYDDALAAEREARMRHAAHQSPADVMSMMTEVFTRSLTAANMAAAEPVPA